MKLAQINLTRSIYIPGIGGTVKLENVECEQGQGGILVTTSAAKVLIPWERVESVVTEWIGVKAPAIVQRIREELLAKYSHPAGDGPVRFEKVDPGLGPTLSASDGIVAQQQNPPLSMAEIAANDAEIKQAIARGAEQAATIGAKDVTFVSGPLAQPPPPQKKGGRK